MKIKGYANDRWLDDNLGDLDGTELERKLHDLLITESVIVPLSGVSEKVQKACRMLVAAGKMKKITLRKSYWYQPVP